MSKSIYLTIDDSPSSDFIVKLDYLDKAGIPAILFCIGKLMEQKADEVIEAIHRGYIIANHSWSHPQFSDCTLKQCEIEIQRTDELIELLYQRAGVERPAKYFRFPYGDKGDGKRGNVFSLWRRSKKERKNRIQAMLKKLGYIQPDFADVDYQFMRRAKLFQDIDWSWTFDFMEWALLESRPTQRLSSIQKILTRLDQKRPADCRGFLGFEKRWLESSSAEVLLIHDHEGTTEYFPVLLDWLKEKDVTFKDFKNL